MQTIDRPPCRAIVTDGPTYVNLVRVFQLVDPANTPTSFFATLDRALAWVIARGMVTPDPVESE